MDIQLTIDKEFRALIPPLTQEERTQLEKNILAEGCRDPLVLWTSTLLDGHNRYEICQRHNLPFEIREIEGIEDREEAINWIIDNQLGRRNLTPEQRDYLLGKKYNREKRKDGGHGDQKSGDQNDTPNAAERIADDYKVGVATVKRAGQFTESVDTIATNVGEEVKQKILTGDSTLTKEAVIVIAQEEPEKQREIFASGETEILRRAKEIKRERAHLRMVRRAEQKAEAIGKSHPLAGERYKLLIGDLLEVSAEIKDESVDAIVTDPPYPVEFLPVYEKLWTLAQRVLRPGGHCLVMVGQSHLPAILSSFYAGFFGVLSYQWTLGYFTPGQSTQVFGRKVKSNWKPILWFVKGKNDWEHVEDTIRSDMNDKRFHEWGQSVGGMAQLIERFTVKNSVVLDPFCGGGTTGVAALSLGRLFIGTDIATSIASAWAVWSFSRRCLSRSTYGGSTCVGGAKEGSPLRSISLSISPDLAASRKTAKKLAVCDCGVSFSHN